LRSLRRARAPVVLLTAMAAMLLLLTVLAPPAPGQPGDELNLQYDDPQPSESPSMLGQLVRVLVSLSLIIGLALTLIRVFGRRVTRLPASGWLNVIDQVALAPNKGLYLTEIAGKYYVLGVTDHQITKVTEVDNPELMPELQVPAMGGTIPEWNWWKRLLSRFGGTKGPNPLEFHTLMEGQLERMRRDFHPIVSEARRARDYR
jgi:flagellar protein FliO/FliZ